MKKLLFISILIAFSSQLFANMRQANWRWRNDDGTETTASWKNAAGGSTVMTSNDEVMRLRILVYWDPINCCGSTFSQVLQYATSTSGPWTNVNATAGTNAFMMAGSSAFLVDNSSTTSQIGWPAYTFVSGKNVVSSVTANYSAASNQYTEIEWAIKGTANTLTNTNYYFRQYDPNMLYSSYPLLVTASVLPVKWVSFTATRNNNTVNLAWATSSEQNNDRYEIMRSTDGRNWKKIGMLKGKGSTNNTTNYQFTDENPLAGQALYMINQFDVDGRRFQSDTRSINMPEQTNTIIEVYPNPTHGPVSFSIVNKNLAIVEVSLANAMGVLVHKEIFKNVTAQSVITLNASAKFAAGVYMLRFQSGKMLETRQVVVY